jgi:hypothetical protein
MFPPGDISLKIKIFLAVTEDIQKNTYKNIEKNIAGQNQRSLPTCLPLWQMGNKPRVRKKKKHASSIQNETIPVFINHFAKET